MDKGTAIGASQAILTESFSLNPSTLVQLFEIDIEAISLDVGILNFSDVLGGETTVFRFHNSNILGAKPIIWQGKQYVPAPIQTEGFEFSSRGTPPTPKFRITVNDKGLPLLTKLKTKLKDLGDLSGARFTRIRTFAKYLDAENFIDKLVPDAFSPDSNVEFPRDIFYIDRKSAEDKFTLEFELAPLFDVEGVKLPGRLVLATKCNATYRGIGCPYEANARRNLDIHELDVFLPEEAPPLANDRDETFASILGVDILDKGQYQKDGFYLKGHAIYITKGGVNYYFVAKVNNPSLPPPNLNYWLFDDCSRNVKGCRIRFSLIGDGRLPFNGFPATNKAI